MHVAMPAMNGEGNTNLTGWFAPFRPDVRSARVYGCISWPAVAGFPLAAWSLAGLTLVVLAAALVFVGLNSGEMTGGRILFYAAATLAVIGYVVIGGLIARRVPGNVIGWLLCLVGLTVAASMFSEQYSLFGLATSPGSVPAVKYVGAEAGGLTVLAIIQLVVLVLVFPDGHLLSRRWRPVLWGMCLALAAGVAQQFQSGTIVQGGMTNALAAAGVAYREPVRGLLPRHGWFSDLLAVVVVVAIASVVLTIVSVFARRRRGTRKCASNSHGWPTSAR